MGNAVCGVLTMFLLDATIVVMTASCGAMIVVVRGTVCRNRTVSRCAVSRPHWRSMHTTTLSVGTTTFEVMVTTAVRTCVLATVWKAMLATVTGVNEVTAREDGVSAIDRRSSRGTEPTRRRNLDRECSRADLKGDGYGYGSQPESRKGHRNRRTEVAKLAAVTVVKTAERKPKMRQSTETIDNEEKMHAPVVGTTT